MTKDEFVPIFDLLRVAYGNRLVNHTATAREKAEIVRVYYLILRDLEAELVQAAALDFISGPSAFPPAPGQVREKAVNLTKRGDKLPSAAEAWQLLMLAPADGMVTWSEQDEAGEWHIYNQPYQWTHPIVEKVALNMGWPDRFWTDNLAADRARFMQAYEVEESRATQEVTSLPEVQMYLAQGPGDIKQIMEGFKREAAERGE